MSILKIGDLIMVGWVSLDSNAEHLGVVLQLSRGESFSLLTVLSKSPPGHRTTFSRWVANPRYYDKSYRSVRSLEVMPGSLAAANMRLLTALEQIAYADDAEAKSLRTVVATCDRAQRQNLASLARG